MNEDMTDILKEYSYYSSLLTISQLMGTPRHPLVEWIDNKDFSVDILTQFIERGYHSSISKGIEQIRNRKLLSFWIEA
jgi:hypothetical protein